MWPSTTSRLGQCPDGSVAPLVWVLLSQPGFCLTAAAGFGLTAAAAAGAFFAFWAAGGNFFGRETVVVVAGLVGCFNAAGLVGCFCSGGFGWWFCSSSSNNGFNMRFGMRDNFLDA